MKTITVFLMSVLILITSACSGKPGIEPGEVYVMGMKPLKSPQEINSPATGGHYTLACNATQAVVQEWTWHKETAFEGNQISLKFVPGQTYMEATIQISESSYSHVTIDSAGGIGFIQASDNASSDALGRYLTSEINPLVLMSEISVEQVEVLKNFECAKAP